MLARDLYVPIHCFISQYSAHNFIDCQGGYLEYVLVRAAKEIFNVLNFTCISPKQSTTDVLQVDLAEVRFEAKKSSDVQEAVVEIDGKVVFRFAQVLFSSLLYPIFESIPCSLLIHVGVWLQEHPDYCPQDQVKEVQLPLR